MRRPLHIIAAIAFAGCQSVGAPAGNGFLSADLSFDSRGVAVPATWVTPVSTAHYPVIVMAHGHGGSRDEAGGFTRIAEALARDGIASLRIDFSGCGDSVESFAENNLDNMLADMRAARSFVIEQPGVDVSRMGLLGFSMGGRVAMLLAESNRYRAIALWAPVGDKGEATMAGFVGGNESWRRLKDEALRRGSVSFTSPWGQQQQLGARWFDDLERSDPLAAIGRFRGALLVVYGDADEIVAPMVSAAVADRADRAGRAEVRRRVIPGAGHGLGFYSGKPTDADDVVAATVSFFRREL